MSPGVASGTRGSWGNGGTERPAMQEVDLQAQLRDLLLRRPVGGIRHGARSEAVDEGDERAQQLPTRRGWPLRPFLPRDIETALEQPQVLAMDPGVDAFQALVRRDLAPEGDPERAFDVPVSIDRQRFEQKLQQVGAVGVAARTAEAFIDASQDQAQRGDDDVLLALEIVGQHAGGVAGFARDAHHAGAIEAVSRDDPTGDECNLIAALGVIDDLGHAGGYLTPAAARGLVGAHAWASAAWCGSSPTSAARARCHSCSRSIERQ